ncbi:MAG: hypothetical protein NW224_12080 [Leptolyngbyaceae cyanobacterium bins.302]|nr:hypothetical protein [Leptolyngbyaceae cyanobacterium bins.302]
MLRPLHWLFALANALLAEIPPPKSQRISQNLITPEQALSPNERDIIARAEESFRLLETQSQAVLERIRETPVISPAPAPVKLVEVPEISEVPEILEMVEPIQSEEPAPAATPHDPEQELFWETVDVPADPPAKINRKQLVEGLLDEAWQQGLRTYAQLMKYVELQTGQSCSKRVVSGWKQSRQLTEAA